MAYKLPRAKSPGTVQSKYKRAISLVELLVGMGIVSFLILIIAGVYIAHFKIFSNQNASIESASQNKIALEDMTNEIRESAGVVTSCPNPPCSPAQTTSASILVLKIWPIDVNGDPIDPGVNPQNVDYIIYQRNPSDEWKLQKKIVPYATSSRQAITKDIAANITALSFTYDNADPSLATQVDITLDTQASNLGKSYTVSQKSTALIRNK